ncbi:hypothetical protein EK21DRAFT_106732 [Setomelanomma holmii]|uniref:DUF7730 domain-containing protein n=1 Tax=Setomelanomma holmii TaxID=210430 RepID=A0A9P4LST7_9PLEO|nr:hypothetical protein EK21DRAFT_106732 [Setomelanomma holmii]
MSDLPEVYEAISRRNQLVSPFSRLPSELKNMIYDYALGNKKVELHVGTAEDGTRYRGYYTVVKPLDPIPSLHTSGRYEVAPRNQYIQNFALLKTCRQIYQETRLLPYQLNLFDTYWTANLAAWSFVYGLEKIRTIRLWTRTGSPMYVPRKSGHVTDNTVLHEVFAAFGGVQNVEIVIVLNPVDLGPGSVLFHPNSERLLRWRNMVLRKGKLATIDKRMSICLYMGRLYMGRLYMNRLYRDNQGKRDA